MCSDRGEVVTYRQPRFYVGTGEQFAPPILGVASPYFSIGAYRCKKKRSVAIKIRQNAFPAGVPPRTPRGGISRRSQRPPTRLAGEGTPLSILHPTRRLDSPALGARHWAPRFEGCPPPQIFSYRIARVIGLQRSHYQAAYQTNLCHWVG